MKRSLLSLTIIAVLAAGLTACGEKPTASTSSTSEAPAVQSTAPAENANMTAGETAKPTEEAKADIALPEATATMQQSAEKAGESAKATGAANK